MKIAVSGLGKMGSQIARKLHEDHHLIFVHNRSIEPIIQMEVFGIKGSQSKEKVIEFFGDKPVVLWLMLPAEILMNEIKDWLPILPENSILIDGGNSDYRNTKKINIFLKKKGINFLDVGTSGGVWGYKNGFSMMVGGNEKSFKKIEPVLKSLSLPSGGYEYFGESGSGHFVKMVHNAIEYGMMESLAEGYRLLKEGPYKKINLQKAGEVWQKRSVISSWLNELIKDALKENPKLSKISGFVAESGEARWAIETAKRLKIEMPSIEASLKVRLLSQKGKVNFTTKLLALMRNAFGGHNLNRNEK